MKGLDKSLIARDINKYDIIVFRGNFEKFMSNKLVPLFGNLFTKLTFEVQDLKKRKKKSIWNIFGNKNFESKE